MASFFGANDPVVELNYKAHTGQLEVEEALRENADSANPAAIIEIIASRGWGKTLFFCTTILIPFLEDGANKVLWVAPTFSTAMAPIEDVFKGTDEVTGKRWIPQFDNDGNQVWEFKTTMSGPVLNWFTGASVSFKSADSPDSIVSRGYNMIIIDEAAMIDERVFTQQILGTARKKGIKIYIISSPRGKKHWTYKYFLRGQDPADTQYLSFQQPYTKNPYFNPTLAKLIKDLPEWLYRQEYLAEFIDDGDSVIRGLESILFGAEIAFPTSQQEWELPITDITLKTLSGDIIRKAAERKFVVSLDLAKQLDFTVLNAMDCETGQVVYYKRINKTDYREILQMSSNVCAKYNQADLIFDSTGVGQGLADVLNNYNVVAIPFQFTNESKVDLINKLIVSIEHQEISIPNIVTLKNELAAFTYSLTRTGKISYNAPSGMHDDTVIALALANFYRKDNSFTDEVGVIEEIIDHNSGGSGPRKSFIEECFDDDN